MTNKELFYFTGQCLMIDEHPEFRKVIIEMIKTNSIDWQLFVANCSNHLILPVIYLKFQSHGIIECLPEELSEFLKKIYTLNLSRNNQILEQLHEITHVLNKNNIYPVFLKGSGNLLDKLYSNIGERILGDIDVLVPEKDWLLSAKLLCNEGYSLAKPIDEGEDIESMYHYPAIFKTGAPTHLEIHRLLSDICQSWFNPSIIDKEKKTVISLNGCYVLSDNHKIIHNFIHGQLHHQGHTTTLISFRDLYDLYLLSKRTPIKRTILDVKCKQKAIAYFVCAGKALGLNEKFYSKCNLTAWLFLKKHDLNLSSTRFNHFYPIITYIPRRIFIGYFGLLIKSLYSKEARQGIIKRLSDRKWYRAQIDSYIIFFFPNK